MDKIFVLGVGCQKGGTTWLHSQLDACGDADMGFTKEYHVFDALYLADFDVFYNQALARFNQSKLSKRGFDNNIALKHFSFYLNTNNYFEYFDYLWLKNDQTTLVGDITPTYAVLPVEAYEEIKTGLESKGFTVKVVFIMRDPIERCWSVSRMNLKNWSKHHSGEPPAEREHLIKKFATHQCAVRTRYDVTIKNLESVFNKDDIFYSLYEDLFTPSTFQRIQGFLQLEAFKPNSHLKINAIDKQNHFSVLDEELERTIFEFYRPTYEYCDSRFGVKEKWLGAKYL